MTTLSAIAAFNDNYIWAVQVGRAALVVDPGEAAPVRQWLAANGLQLHAILLTHHHSDHIGGVSELVQDTDAAVYGHAADQHRLPPLTYALSAGDSAEIPQLGLKFSVLFTPGHTLGHICYHGFIGDGGTLFCGDTLFSGGCGRMFEGQPAQYHQSLMQLAALPDDTAVCCGHEYTESNLAFAAKLLPADSVIADALADTRSRRAAGEISLPSRLARERRINPFLRCAEPALATAVGLHGAAPATVFAAVRGSKDQFTGR